MSAMKGLVRLMLSVLLFSTDIFFQDKRLERWDMTTRLVIDFDEALPEVPPDTRLVKRYFICIRA